MSIKDLILNPAWQDIESILKDKMNELLMDIDLKKPFEEIGMEAIANRKAYNLLDKFLKDMDFYKGEDKLTTKRNYE